MERHLRQGGGAQEGKLGPIETKIFHEYLVIDVGGTHVKILASGEIDKRGQ
jgi:hypothetical protein